MSDEANIYPPLTKEEIEAVIDKSVHSENLENLLDVNFVGLDRPCSVSLGIDCGKSLSGTRVELISEILKSYGIDVVDRSSPDAVDPSKYILDRSGISLPFMEPREALKATTELNDIFIQHGFSVTGYASPRTQESLCLSTKYEGKVINVSGELDDNPKAAAILEKHGISVEDFIQQQLEEASKLPAIDVGNVDATALSPDGGIKYLYRGASLGDNPYAVVASKCSKDIVYSSPKMSVASGYSTGLAAGFAEVNTPDGKTLKYGNIYRYSATEDLNLWDDFGYEKGMGHVIGDKAYETPVFAHKNKVNGIFFVVEDENEKRRVVQITDDNGKYISKEWEDFMALHAPRMRAGTELDKQYNDNQIKMLAEGKLSSWKVRPCGKELDLSNCKGLDLSGVDLSQFEDLKLPEKIMGLGKTKFPMNMKQLDLSKSGGIDLSNADLSQFEDLKLSPFFSDITNTKFPEGKSWFEFCDLEQIKDEWSLPRGIKSLEGIKFPETLKRLDLSSVYNLDLSGADLSSVEDLKLPRGIKSLEGIKFPETLKRLDLSSVFDINLSGVDLPPVEDLKLPRGIEGLEEIKFPETLKRLDLSTCCGLDLSGVDLPPAEDLKLPINIETLEGIKFSETLKQLDLSGCYGLNLSGVDLSQFEDLTLPSSIKSLEGIKLPKKLDISYCHSLELAETDLARFDELTIGRCSDMDLSTFKGKLNFSQECLELDNVKLPQSLRSLDLTGSQSVFQNTDFGEIQELKLPEYTFRGDLGQVGEKIGELCGGDESKLEKMSLSVITPDCKLDNLKKLDAQACKDLDLRDWNLDKIEELKLPKNFDMSKLPEGIMERNPAVARAVKISRGEIVETLEPVQNAVKEKVDLPPEIKAEKAVQTAENSAADRIAQLRGVKNSGVQAAAESGEKVVEKTVEKTVAHAGAEAVKSSDGIVSAIAKADNAVNQAIDKTIEKGSELLNNNAVGRAYEKAAEKVADTKVVKAVEKTTAKVAEKAANTAVGKAVVKTAAKAAGSAVGKSAIKKIPLVSAAAGCYFAWDRIKDGDWKGACGEVASGVAGCFPGIGTAASAAIDVGLAAKDIKAAVDESKQPVAEAAPNTEEEKTAPVEQTEEDKKKMRDIILQKQGRISSEARAQAQQVSQQNHDYALQQKMAQQGRG